MSDNPTPSPSSTATAIDDEPIIVADESTSSGAATATAVRVQQPTNEAGWYHVAGDPPGTVRRWNGFEWIGFPQPDPRIPQARRDPVILDGAEGQFRLAWWGRLAQLAMLVPIVGYSMLAYLMWRETPTVNELVSSDLVGQSAREIGDRFVDFELAARIASGGHVIAAPFFILWFYLAYRNLSRLVHTQHHKSWAVIGWLIPLANLFMPGSIMSDLVYNSPSRRRAGAINPILPNAWWFLYLLPNVVTPLLFIWMLRTDDVTDLRLIYWVSAAVVTLLALSAVLAFVLIQRISSEQDRRLGSR